MEVLVLVDTKEVEASLAVEDDVTATLWKEKKRRRVSFAHTDTVHLIPRNDDLQTTPPVLNADRFSIIHKTPLPTAEASPSKPALYRTSAPDPDLHSSSHVRENSADFSRFTSDMDTSHGSWTDEESTTRRNSFDGSEDDSGCFVHLGHISGLEDDDSIVNDVINEDITMDASTFSRNLSYYLKSDPEGTCSLGQLVSHKNANDVGSRSDGDSISLTTSGAPHWALVYPRDVSLHADGDQSDMSLATGTVFNTTVPMCNLKDLLLDQTDHTITRNQSREVVSTGKVLEAHNFGPDSIQSHSHSKHSHSDPQNSDSGGLSFPPSKREVVAEKAQDVSLHADDAQSDMSFSTGTIFNTTLPMCKLKDLLDQTDLTITRRESTEAVSTGKILRSCNFEPDTIHSHSHSQHGPVDPQSSDHGEHGPPLSKKEVIVENAQDLSLLADDAQSNTRVARETVFATPAMCNFKDLLLSQTDHTTIEKQSREVSTSTKLESSNFKPNGIQSHSHSKQSHADFQSSTHNGLISSQSRKEVLVENVQKPSSVKTDQIMFIRDAMKSKYTDAGSAASKDIIESKKLYEVSTQGIIMAKVFAGVGVSNTFGRDPCTKGLRCIEDILQCIKGKIFDEEDKGGEENIVPLLPSKLQTLGDYLQFSCKLQPQMDCLREHIQELEAKLQAAKKRNAEIKSSNIFVQKLLEESTLTFKTKFSSMQSLAKKRWLLWKMKLERQILVWLQESKDNLIREYEAVHGKSQQVLHLKESYSQIVLYHRYQDVCERLRISKDKWNKMQAQIHSIASVYGHTVLSAADSSESSFENNLETQIQRLIFMSSILQQQQVMQSTLKSKEGKSLIDFCLDGMCSQSFQFEGGGPFGQVELSRNLYPKAIEMTFPCMDASLVFQYINFDLHNNAPVQLQRVYHIIQHTNYLFGCLMDVLMEIRYCRRSFRMSCKFQMEKDMLVLNATFLRSASGLKVTLMFDMVCIKVGLYPSNLKPADIEIKKYGCPSNDSITRKDVMERVSNVQPGFPRLYKICRCVEELMSSLKEID